MDEHHLLKQFIDESEEIIESLQADLDQLTDQQARGRINPDLLNRIFRAAHSLKGMAGMAGLGSIQIVSHRFEDLLDDVRMGRYRPSPEALAGFAQVVEGLRRLIAAAERGQALEAEADRLVALVDSIRSGPVAPKVEADDSPLQLDEQVRRTLTEYEEHRLAENLQDRRPIYELFVAFDLMVFDERFRRMSEGLSGAGEVISTLPGVGADDPMQIAFRIIYASDEPLESVSARMAEFGGTATMLSHYPELAVVAEGPATDAEAGGALDPRGASDWAEPPSSSVRVEMRDLDELAVLTQRLALKTAELASQCARVGKELGLGPSGQFELRQAARTIERGFIELEERLVELRLVPLGQTFTRARRLVRRVAIELDREVELTVEGEEVPLDKAIVDRIAEPLAHLLHNAVDHGIEPPDAREAAGKSRAGRIALKAESSGSRVVISVSDDGAGIDAGAVRRAAEALGIAVPGQGPGGVFDVIFRPGISTAESVSAISGRGVGLDAVAAAVTSLGGEIGIESEPGVGTTFRLVLPTTLVMISAFLVEVRGLTYAVDVNQLSELGLLEPSAIAGESGRPTVTWRDASLPFVDLASVLRLGAGQATGGKLPCLIARAGENQAAVAVDRFVEEREVIVKTLGRYAGRLRGVNGAIDLEGGRVALLLDIPALIAGEVGA